MKLKLNPKKDNLVVRRFDHKSAEVQFEYHKEKEEHVVFLKFNNKYLIPLTDDLRFQIVDALTQKVGTFPMQLYEVDANENYVKSSPIFNLIVQASLIADEQIEVHDPDLDLLFLQYKEEYDRIVLAKDNMVAFVNDLKARFDAGEFNGKDGEDGKDGFSPVASVSKVGNKSTVTITDKNGTTSAEILDGKNGKDGDDYVLTEKDKQDISDLVPRYDDTEIKQDISDLKEDDEYLKDKINEIELAKFPNVTIYGEPTINQGQISNFSSVNYLQFPFVVNFQNKKFEIEFEFTTGADVSNQHNILDSNFGLAFAVRTNRFVVAISTNGTNWNVGEGVGTHVVNPNTTYRVKMDWNGTDTFTLAYSEDGGQNYIVDITKTLTSQPYPKQMYIGISYDKAHNFNGIVNLNFAKLTIADLLVWQGMGSVESATKLDVNLSNIDEEGKNKLNELNVESGYVKNTDYATADKGGVIKVNTWNGVQMLESGAIRGVNGTFQQYQGRDNYFIISKGTLENIKDQYVKQGMTSEVTEQNKWTPQEQAMARKRIGEPQFELIERIVINSTEPTTITRSSEPNGTPYSFKKLRICIKNEINTIIGNYGQLFLFNNGLGVANFEMGNLSSQTYNTYAFGMFNMGDFAMYTRFLSQGSGTSMLYHRFPYDYLLREPRPVTSIQFPPITGQSTIEIYGVRA